MLKSFSSNKILRLMNCSATALKPVDMGTECPIKTTWSIVGISRLRGFSSSNILKNDIAQRDLLRTWNPIPLFYADWAEVILPDGHRFPMDKYRRTRLAIEEDASLRGLFRLAPSPLAKMSEVLAVHCAEYASKFVEGRLSDHEMRTIGFPWTPSTVQRSLASTGGTVACMHEVMLGRVPVAAQLAGGTHHAFADRGEGFCAFNDMAVAATSALQTYGDQADPILILDLDVHQGNGTASIFEDEERVVTFDMFGDKNYPWKTRMKNTYDVPLKDTMGDQEYLTVLEEWLPWLFTEHAPKLVFFQAGVDALMVDSFGRLGMTRAGMLRRNVRVYRECIERGVPLVICMGGGYSRPMDESVAAHTEVYASAIRSYVEAHLLNNEGGHVFS